MGVEGCFYMVRITSNLEGGNTLSKLLFLDIELLIWFLMCFIKQNLIGVALNRIIFFYRLSLSLVTTINTIGLMEGPGSLNNQ